MRNSLSGLDNGVCTHTHACQDFSAAIELEENMTYDHPGR